MKNALGLLFLIGIGCQPNVTTEGEDHSDIQTEMSQHQLVVYNSIFGPSTPVEAWVGETMSTGALVVIYRNKSTGACGLTTINNSNTGITQNIEISLSSGNDTATLLGKASTNFNTGCTGSWPLLKGPHFNSDNLWFTWHGLAGDDTLVCGATAVAHNDGTNTHGMCQLDGNDGNDLLISYANWSALWGGAGNDKLVTNHMETDVSNVYNVGGVTIDHGGDGNDCLESNGVAATSPVLYTPYAGDAGNNKSTQLRCDDCSAAVSQCPYPINW